MEQYAEVLSAGWPAVSGGAEGWLAPTLNSLADDITAVIVREVEEYAQPGDEAAARAVRRVAHDAVAGFAARVTAPSAPSQATASAAQEFHDVGRLLAMEGRSLNALHAALRIGARVTWQRLQEQARQGNGDPEAFARIGETVFWYMDELGASCSAGYAEARAELAGETSQLRRHLLEMLTSSPAPPAAALARETAPRAARTPRPESSGAKTTCRRSSCSPTLTWPRRSARRPSSRCDRCAPSRRTGWAGRCSPGSRVPATRTPPPAACTSTRRRSATGYGSCPNCSVTRSPNQTPGSGCCSPCASGCCSALPNDQGSKLRRWRRRANRSEPQRTPQRTVARTT